MSESATAKALPKAEIYYSKQGPTPTVEVVVPYGTTLAQVTALHDVISRQAIAKISPRGNSWCIVCGNAACGLRRDCRWWCVMAVVG